MPGTDEARTKALAIATELKHCFKARKPKFTAKWSREWVIPDNVLLPNDAKAAMHVDATFPANRPGADVEVSKAWNGEHVVAVSVPPLQLKQGRVVTGNGARPAHAFNHENGIWDEYDQLEYHFACRIDRTIRRTPKAIKVKRWHVIALDKGIDVNPTRDLWTLSCVPMRDNFLANLTGANDHAKAWEFVADTTRIAVFGEKMKNTYTFMYVGHGAVMCRSCLGMYDCFTDPTEASRQAMAAKGDYRTDAERTARVGKPAVVGAGAGASFTDADFGIWTTCSQDGCTGNARSTHCIEGWQAAPTPSFMDGSHVADTAVCPTTPKYLAFSVCCGGAFDSSLFDAYIGRGTRYAIGFRKAARGDWACDYAKSLFDTWAGTHHCDPSRIPEVFDGLQATWQIKLQPRLFGRYLGVGSHLRNLGRAIAALF